MSSPPPETDNGRKLFAGVLLLGAALAVGLILLAAFGGGPDYKARGVVKGRVTSNKKPLTTGTVVFHNKNGITSTSNIDPQGNYVMNDAPIGECQITVYVGPMPTDPSVRARLKGGGKGPKMPEMKAPEGVASPDLPSGPSVPKEIVSIDAKYAKPETSGLNITVEMGERTFDIDL